MRIRRPLCAADFFLEAWYLPTSRDVGQRYLKSSADLVELRIVESEDIIWRPCVTINQHHFRGCESGAGRVLHTCAISRGRTESKRVVIQKITTCKSALGWLANKGERWMPRLEKAMKDVA